MQGQEDDGDISLSLNDSPDEARKGEGEEKNNETAPNAPGPDEGDISIALEDDDGDGDGSNTSRGIAAAAEPVPLDPEQVAPSITGDDPTADSAADGAWSTTVTPKEEISEGSVELASPATSSSAKRSPAYDDTQRPSILAIDDEVNLNRCHRDDGDGSPHHHFGHRYHRGSENSNHDSGDADDGGEMDRVDLGFEDITLDDSSGAVHRNDVHDHDVSSLNSRTDSVSNDRGRSAAAAAVASPSGTSDEQPGRLRFWRRSTQAAAAPTSTSMSPPPSTSRNISVDITHENHTPHNDHHQLASQSADAAPARSPGKALGRYKGRFSQPNSPSVSPRPDHRSTWLPEPTSGTMPSAASGVTMMVAGDDGEIEVSEIDDVPASQGIRGSSIGETAEGSGTEAPKAPSVTESSPPPPQSTANEQSARGGRSAGPLDAHSGVADGNADVRQETAAEAEARQQQKTGGRSAGPINSNEEAADARQSSSVPSTSTAAPATQRAGGRSAGPILATASPTSPTRRPPSGHSGPSALEKHMSRTRQATLPPKARTEDQRHLRDFEGIMREYKAAEAKRQRDEEERLRKKEVELREATKIWEDEILKDWKVARSNPRLRETWWKGAPPSLRGRIWQLTIGNALMLPRNLCATTKTRVGEMRSSGKWPPDDADVDAAILDDIARTLPSLKLFQVDGPMHDDLRELLECIVLLRHDQAAEIARSRSSSSSSDDSRPPLYAPGLSLLSAMLLLNLSQSEALIALLNLIHSKPWLSAIYSMDPAKQRESEAFERVLNTFLADQLPKVYANMQIQNVRPSTYAREWVRNLFTPLLPLEVVSRLWDNIILEEGDSLLFRTCLALVSFLSSRLYIDDAMELTTILQGKNRAALSVWYRSLQSAPAKDHASVQAVASLPNSPLSPQKTRTSGGGGGGGAPGGASASVILLPPVLEEQQAARAKALADAEATRVAKVNEDTASVANGSDAHAADQNNGEQIDTSPTSPSSSGVSTPQPPPRSSSRTTADDAVASPSSSSPPVSSIEAPSSWVPRDSLFSVYALDEDKLFTALEEQVGEDGWWRQSTMDRLVDRELGG